ncbi:hypothetical protein AALO_G00227800 [Alosa alosa]|uniref:Uncharacterized protein n=1 Tax=Alosa alosa TaxID=278164 RepID=A0AAV6FZU9_9TELE|nr:hypothetical protein AALO_G00227800 [Alosa alosa]
MTRTRVHPEPPDEGSSPEPRWTPVVERTQSDNRLLGIFKSSFLGAMGTHRRSEQQIRTHNGSTSSSSPSSILEPVWELCPTTRALPRPAPPTQPRLAFAVKVAGTNTQNVTCGCQAGVPLQPQLAQIFPGPSAHCSNPCPVIISFPVVPCHHRASRAGMLGEMEDKENKLKKESQAGVKDRDKKTADAAAHLLQRGSERTSHSYHHKADRRSCPLKNTLAKDLPLSHGGQSDSLILNCSSIQGKCACPHQFMSVADIHFRDPSHEPHPTLICASTLKPVARRNGTQSPPVRAAMDNNVESEGEESDSEDSSSDDEEDTAKLPPSDTNSHAVPKPSHITGNMDDQRLTYLQNMVLTTERKLELTRTGRAG